MPTAGRIKVLLIDDHEEDYFYIRDLLLRACADSFRLEFCSDPDEALEHLTSQNYDVFLVDANLEKCESLNLLKQAAEKGIKHPLVLFSLKRGDEVEQRARSIGLDNFLFESDLNPNVIGRILTHAIEKHQLKRSIRIRDQKLLSLSKFQELTASISRKLIVGFGESLEHEVLQALSEFGEFLNVDRCRLYEIGYEKSLTSFCVWTSVDRQNHSDNLKYLDSKYYPTLIDKLSKKEMLVVDEAHKTNLWETETHEFLKSIGIETMILNPLFFKGEWVGVLAIESSKEVVFNKVDESLFKLVSGMLADVMERRQSNLIIEKVKSEEDKVFRMKSDFLSNMSHELRTPLNSILGMSDVLNDSELKDEQKECLGVLTRAANNLKKVFDDIFEFAHIEEKDPEASMTEFNIKEMLNGKIYKYQNLKDHSLLFDFKLEKDFCHWGLGDQESLSRILDHLLSNAYKFTREGQVEVFISNHRIERDKIIVYVKDSGEGIEEKELERVFDSFYQTDTSMNSSNGGTGLGLTIVKRMLDFLNCEIELQSQKDSGTSVKFTFPYKALHLNMESEND